MFIDTHAHLSTASFAQDLSQVLKRASEYQIRKIINVACDKASFEISPILKDNKQVYFSFGIDPGSLQDWDEKLPEKLRNLLRETPRVVAVGEMGLDFYWKPYDEHKQREVFIAQLKIAKELNLAVIVHSRAAEQESLKILQENDIKKAVLHCYTGDLKTALQATQLGYYLSFTGILTYPKNKELQRIASAIPLNRILLESDCPYLAPQTQRGERNQPAYLLETAKFLADLRQLSLNELSCITNQNVQQLFGV